MKIIVKNKAEELHCLRHCVSMDFWWTVTIVINSAATAKTARKSHFRWQNRVFIEKNKEIFFMKLLKRKRNMDHVTNFIPSPCKMSIVYTQKNIRMFIKFHCKNAVFTTPKVNTSTFITHHLDLIGHGSAIKMQLEHNARQCLQWKKSQPRRKSHYVVNLVLNTVAAAASAARIEKVFMRFGSLSTTSSAVTIQFMMFLFKWYLAPQDIIKLLFSNWRRRYCLPDNNRSHHKCLVHH